MIFLPSIMGCLTYRFLGQEDNFIHGWLYKWIYGWIILFAIFEVTAVPLVLLKKTLSELCIVYLLVVFLVGIILFKFRTNNFKQKKYSNIKEKRNIDETILALCVIGIVLFQVFLLYGKHIWMQMIHFILDTL